MSIRSVTKKTWPILAVFALGGITLGIVLPATGIFIPFGVTILGVFAAGALLFLASIGVATLLIITMNAVIKIFKYLASQNFFSKTRNTTPQKPVISTTKTVKSITEIPTKSTALNITTSTSFIPPLTQAPSSQTLSPQEQAKQDAKRVRDYLITLFQSGGEFYKPVALVGRGSSLYLHQILQNDDAFGFEHYPGEANKPVYEIKLRENRFCQPLQYGFFSSEEARTQALTRNHLPSIGHEGYTYENLAIDPIINDTTSNILPQLEALSVFVEAIKTKWGPDTVTVTRTKKGITSYYEEPYHYTYEAIISLEKIRYILSTLPGNKPPSSTHTPQPLPSGEQSQKDAEEVKNYLANLFIPDNREAWVPLGGRSCNRTLEWALKQASYFYVESITSSDQPTRYKIVFSDMGNEDFNTQDKLDDNCGLKYFQNTLNKKWNWEIVKIGTRNCNNLSFYKAEIFPEGIQEILREMRSNQPTLTKS